MGGNTLIEYYRLHFLLKTEHHYSINELEEMYPFERELFVELLLDHIDKQRDETYGQS